MTRAGERPPAPARWAAAVAGGCLLWLAVGGGVGLTAGSIAAAMLGRWLGGREPRAERERRERLAEDLPVALDLLAACLLAGGTVDRSLTAVAEAVGGPLGDRLQQVAAATRLGADPGQAWARLGLDPEPAGLARMMARAMTGGLPPAAEVGRLADELRAQRRWALAAAAHRVGVKAVLPLGVCFLPAFVLIGVVPVLAGLVTAAYS